MSDKTRRCPDCEGCGYHEDDSPEGGFMCTRCDGDGVIPDEYGSAGKGDEVSS